LDAGDGRPRMWSSLLLEGVYIPVNFYGIGDLTEAVADLNGLD
jgi:hypothetical protein